MIVITYGYALAVTNGLLLPDPAALAETADVLHNAEKSGDDCRIGARAGSSRPPVDPCRVAGGSRRRVTSSCPRGARHSCASATC